MKRKIVKQLSANIIANQTGIISSKRPVQELQINRLIKKETYPVFQEVIPNTPGVNSNF